jgi:hypothetical protein
MLCGKFGIDHAKLSLPEPVDEKAYARKVKYLIRRNIIRPDGINLTEYGQEVERVPCSVEWAELVVNSPPELLSVVAICSASSGLFRTLKPEAELEYGLSEFVVPGSDHLTLYNIVAHAISNFAEITDDKGYTEYSFREKEFYDWAEAKGVNAKEIEEIALALKSILHNQGMPLPEKLVQADKKMQHEFVSVLTKVESLDIVRNERDIYGNEVMSERLSQCGAGEIVFGKINAWLDAGDEIRRAIEGTAIPRELLCLAE